MIIDIVAILLLGLLLVRGWWRGFVREAMDLVGLILGTVLAFRLAPFMGGVVNTFFDVSEPVARLIGGSIVLVAVGVALAIVTRSIDARFQLPGLNLINRVGGAGLASAWGIFLATLVLTVGVVLPMPPSISDQLDSSAVTRTLTDPDGLAQEVFNELAGNRLVAGVLRLRELVGSRRVVIGPGESLVTPAADPGDLEDYPDTAQLVFELLNEARVAEGRTPLIWSDALAGVAASHAREMYLEGYFAHESPTTGDVGDRLSSAGIGFSVAGENLALAATAHEVHDGLMDSPGHRANMLSDEFEFGGVAVVSGPLGLMTVQVFSTP